MATVNMPVFGTITITPAQIIAGDIFSVSVVVTDSPVPVYPVSVYSNEIYSGEEHIGWP